MYFYVPKGTTKFIVHNAIGNGPDTFEILDATGAHVATASGATTIVPVCTTGGTTACPNKQDGTIWTFNKYKSSSPVSFELIPNVFSPSREQ
jgi:hypothetical protein